MPRRLEPFFGAEGFQPPYAVECGLKACMMGYVEASGVIFQDRRFSEKCWTHDPEALLFQANLKPALDALRAVNANFAANGDDLKDWGETSRYQQKTQAQAQALYNAMTANPDGVFQWIQNHC